MILPMLLGSMPPILEALDLQMTIVNLVKESIMAQYSLRRMMYDPEMEEYVYFYEVAELGVAASV